MNKHDSVTITIGRVEKLEAHADVARVLLAALEQLAERVQDVTRNAGYGAGMFEPEMAEARSAIRKAQAAKVAK